MKHTMAVLALFGCQGGVDESSEGVTEAAVVSTNPATPYVGPPVNNLSAYPALAAHGRVTEGPFHDTSKFVPHGARFTNGEDLAPPPVNDIALAYATAGAWADTFTATGTNAVLHPPAMKPRMHEALVSAKLRMAGLSAKVLDDAAKIFSLIPGFTTPVAHEQTEFAAWHPPRSRWLDSQWAFAPRAPGTRPVPETHYRYPTPAAFGLMAQRGARLYCAAREMTKHQDNGSLGKKVLLPLEVLGKKLDIGVFEPFAYVDNPEKFIGTAPGNNDGVQVFNIPLQLGLKISPIRDVLPALPELRTPLVLTATDVELVTDTDRGLVWESNACFGFLCVPVIRPMHQQRFKTVTHVDSALTTGRSITTNAEFPLFWAGPLSVRLKLGFGASVGMQIPPIADEPRADRPKVFDDRILAFAIPQPDWSTNIRKGGASEPYLDGYWKLPQNYSNPDSNDQFYDVHSVFGGTDSIAGVVTIGPQSAFRSAVLADDDHHVAPMSELALLAGLKGTIGLNASIARIEISASGDVKGTLGLAHDVRDAVSVDAGLFSKQPVTNLLITPTTYGEADLFFKVNFHLMINLGLFGTIDVNYDLVNKTIDLARFEDVWSEEHRVRLGTGSTVGVDVTQQPHFMSHVGSVAFQSFPVSVDACLADNTDRPSIPPPCKDTPASGELPRVEACMYMPISEQIDACSNIPVNATTPALKCEAAKRAFLCSAVSKQQTYGAEYVLAHRLALPEVDEAYSTELETIATMAELCAMAESPPINPLLISGWFASQFKVAPCDATATLSTADTVVGLGSSAVTAGDCKPSP